MSHDDIGIDSKKDEYIPPNASSCREKRAELNAQIQAYLNGGGMVETVPGDLVITDAHKRTKAKRDSARKRGKAKMRGVTA